MNSSSINSSIEQSGKLIIKRQTTNKSSNQNKGVSSIKRAKEAIPKPSTTNQNLRRQIEDKRLSENNQSPTLRVQDSS